ncbi:sugar phosphate isomerase/epimerase [Tessaracoccus sp. SD287]|uniref:sugar phosphate isomerase/epimerase family protein n=1 Tax=Tessaracoccus sp. SD287 TaxID=2782008 RepID=UPI001A96DD28|nr:sugar phosphate isomerase/epimerase [Tessaracoccus sp. SD287]
MSASVRPAEQRLSLNQKTVNHLGLAAAIDLCRRHGIESIGVWREPLAEVGLQTAARMLSGSGLRVSSLCRGGWFTATGAAFDQALAENRRAVDEAAALAADCLCLVVGGLPPGSTDLVGARTQMARALDALVPYAAERGVRFALEPMHPIFAADRGVLSTLAQALDLAEDYPAETVGVMVDTYHVWWDPALAEQVARAGAAGRIASYQVCDWMLPLAADALLSRGMMGDGHIDFAAVTAMVSASGYAGDVEVEIFNADIWAADPDQTVTLMKQRYLDLVAPRL